MKIKIKLKIKVTWGPWDISLLQHPGIESMGN